MDGLQNSKINFPLSAGTSIFPRLTVFKKVVNLKSNCYYAVEKEGKFSWNVLIIRSGFLNCCCYATLSNAQTESKIENLIIKDSQYNSTM